MYNRWLRNYRWALLLLLFALIPSVPANSGTIHLGGLIQALDASPDISTPGHYLNQHAISFEERSIPDRDAENHVIVRAEGTPGGEMGSKEWFARASIWWALLVTFMLGLALNLTPCIYPLIPITISYFGGKGQHIRGQTIVHGLLYMCGLAVTNSLLGLSAALSGGMLGFALQHPAVLLFVVAVIVAMGLSFFGVWELRLPLWLTRAASKSHAGFFGTFFMGLTLGIVAAPCIGPFILGLLVYVGQRGSPLLGFLYFFVLSIGLGLPLSVLAVFSGSIARLPKSGDWMLWIRKLMGWVLLGMAAFMVGPVISSDLLQSSILAGVVVAAGIHLCWLDKTWGRIGISSYLKKAIGVAIMCSGIIYLATSAEPLGEIEWVPYTHHIMAKATQEKKPVILEFSAEWCKPCLIMEKNVFADPEVIELSRNFVNVRVDMTTTKAFHDELLRKYGIRGIPAAIFINRDGVQEKLLRIEGYAGKQEFIKRMKDLLNRSPSTGG
jgi:thiol:disulfide interchange protein DsbD